MRRFRFIGMVLAASALGASPQIADRRVLIDQGRLLEIELALAKTNKTYLHIDLSAGRLELRNQGLVLAAWPLAGFSLWGRPVPSGSFKLRKMDALRTPERKNITPGADKEKSGKTKSGDPEVLEVKDMPGHFSLECEGGITIHFKAAPRKFFKRVSAMAGSLGRSISLPLRTLTASIRKADFTDIQIILTGESDVQSLYWSSEEGMSILLIIK